MIGIKVEGAIRAPVFVCDVCKKEITRRDSGAVIFHATWFDPHDNVCHVPDKEVLPVTVLHKSKCFDFYEEKHGHLQWMEINSFLHFLISNSGLGLSDITEDTWTGNVIPQRVKRKRQ